MGFRRNAVSIVVCCVLVASLSACGDDKKPAAKSPKTTTTIRRITTTIASVPTGPAAPLTGVPGDAEVTRRPALTVKVENTRQARPLVGVQSADVVYEEVVEGGITRLAAVFQSHIPAVIGPVRSVRRTDQAIVRPIQGIFVYSGGARYAEDSIKDAPVVRFDESSGGPAMFRDRQRTAPHNLFLKAPEIFTKAPNAVGPPGALFRYGTPSDAGTAALAVEVGFTVDNAVRWVWDRKAQYWNRFFNGRPDTDSDGAQIHAVNVVIQQVRYKGGTGKIGAEAELLGSGGAWILSGGRVVVGTWQRSDAASAGELLDASGGAVELLAGNTWVALPDPSYSVKVS